MRFGAAVVNAHHATNGEIQHEEDDRRRPGRRRRRRDRHRAVPPTTAPAHADAVPPNCQVVPWGFLGLTQKRAICGGPIQPGGSWMRHRTIGVPRHYAYPSRSCSSDSYSSYCTYYPGGWVDEVDSDDETYSVTADTVLPDEPGHLG